MKKAAIIVAGGSGERIGGSVPKQFLIIKGKPLLFYTLEKFEGIVDEIILVLPEAHLNSWKNLCEEHNFRMKCTIVCGGISRSESVRNALKILTGSGLVAIHDAVRPFISKLLINRLFSEALHYGNAIPVIAVKESLRYQNGNKNSAVKRSEYVTVQTPQIFDIETVKEAYESVHESETDDASVVELSGVHMHLVEGESTNIKVTFREDILIAEALLNASLV